MAAQLSDSVRSFQGALYYAAFYDRALSEAEISAQAVALTNNDDRP